MRGVMQDQTLLYTVTALQLVLFTVVATLDGLYLHLYRYRLWERPASRYEHRLHTINAVIFPFLTWLLYCADPRGAWLWLAAGLFAATFAVEIVDVRCEYASRADIGGLGQNEYLMHFFMAAMRFGAVMPLLLAPDRAWPLDQTGFHDRPLPLRLLGWCVATPAIVTATLHVVLDIRGRARGGATP